MPFIICNNLQKRLARGCILIAFSFALGWGEALGAYLPGSGPAPLRFRPVTAQRLKKSPVSELVTALGNAVDHPSMFVTDMARQAPGSFVDFLSMPCFFGPFQSAGKADKVPDQNNAGLKVVEPAEPVKTAADDTVYPQFLVPFFTGEFSGTNAPAVPVKIIEFNPPTTETYRSSTAKYLSN